MGSCGLLVYFIVVITFISKLPLTNYWLVSYIHEQTHSKLYMKWIIYELRIWNQVKLWSSQLWTQFLQLRKEAWEIQDFNGVWTRDLAIPVRRSNQLNYEATNVRNWSFVCSQQCSREEWINDDISFHRWFIPHGNIRTQKWPAPKIRNEYKFRIRITHGQQKRISPWEAFSVVEFVVINLLRTCVRRLHF